MVEHVEEILEWFWKDNVKAKVMQPDGSYIPRITAEGEPPFDAQAEFLAEAQIRRKRRTMEVPESALKKPPGD
jgi:polyphosphate kinase